MKHALMLIESPNKINSISKYLAGTNIDICATIGHIRELDSKSFNGLGFDEDTYEMKWTNDSVRTVKGRTYDVIKEINAKADGAEEIYLSTDPDREGEAIAWHIYEILSPKNKKKCKRVVFNEITKSAITKALEDPRDLDQGQIDSYWARKLLDRGLGFKMSDFTRRSIGGASAGRVQSIALKFLKDKYDEIIAFVPDHWFNLIIFLDNGLEIVLKELPPQLKLELKDCENGLINFVTDKDAEMCLGMLGEHFTLVKIDEPKEENQKPPKPFKTSTMQSSAINKLHMSANVIDRLAQNLYEGVEIHEENGSSEFMALITYPRTDREDLSDTFVKSASDWIFDFLGKPYLASDKGSKKGSASKDKKKVNLVQGAHEAIRPVDISITPRSLEGRVKDRKLIRLYSLIWLNAVSSLMSSAINNNVLYHFENNGFRFTANNRIELFDGFKKLFREYSYEQVDMEEHNFPSLKLNTDYVSQSKDVHRVDKKPPSPYTESTLIKALEKEGIGRPSTYSHIVGIVQSRDYATKEGNKLNITELGINMSNALEKCFPKIMKYDYTRNMELELDNISEHKSNWKDFLKITFQVFNKELELAWEQAKKISVGVCPQCGGDLKSRYSRKTKRNFVGCSNYPECKYIQSDNSSKPKPELVGKKCPQCGSDLVKRIGGKFKKPFVGCSNYPECKYIDRPEPVKEEIGENCPTCSSPLVKVMGKYNKPYIRCSSSTCKFYKSWKQENIGDNEGSKPNEE